MNHHNNKIKIDYHSSLQKRQKSNKFILIIFLIFLFLVFIGLSFIEKNESTKKKEKEADLSVLKPELKSKTYKETIKKGVTLSDILKNHGFSAAQIYQIKEEAKPIYNLAHIKAGNDIRINISQEGELNSIEYDIDKTDYLHIQKTDGKFKCEIKKIPYTTKIKSISSTIKDNLITSVAKKNEQDYLALSLADIFAWDIDFYSDLRYGDSFIIIFEKKYLNGVFTGYGRILASEFTNQGKTFQAFYYKYPDTGEWDYFDPKGQSLRKEFLKSPIKFARITSRFSLSRFHPLRKVYRPHYGVDYGAPIGTPVQSTADGIVTNVGWNGAAGRMIKIKHSNHYETMYLHLRSYSKGIRKGKKVKGGQVIGTVGSSGESTGPHLDYRIKYRGKYINPIAWRFKPVTPIRKGFLEDFHKKSSKYAFYFFLFHIMNKR
ncbi:MAG: peptidoglycan DD-metalloendopeptidase family protein [Candidatus Aminicenantaceae bacterium]